MGKKAQVTSISAIRDFKAALQTYQEALSDCLDSLGIEVRRGLSWIESDRMSYWPVQVRQSSDALTEAKNSLERKRLTLSGNDRPSCTEEKKAVEVAKNRLRYCEERLANSKYWLRIISHDAEEFQGLIAKVSHLTESDIPRAIAKLEQLATALDKYTQIQTNTRSTTKQNASSNSNEPQP